jgi:signal transduction histidine kinase
MLAEIFVAVLVLTVALLVAGDVTRRKSEGPHGYADGSAHDARPTIIGASRGGRAEAFPREPAGTGIPAGHVADSTRRPENISPSAGGHQHSRTGASAAPNGARSGLKNRHVRSRLLVLVTIPAVAVAVIALCISGLTAILQGTRIHSPSTRNGAILSALAIGVVMIVVLVLAAWFTIVTARSVLRPLYRLRGRALEAVGIRPPDAASRVSENDGENAPSDRESVDVDSPNEIGDVARAVKAMRGELLRIATNEAALHGKLDVMFVNLSNRSKSLVERQIRLIESLEHSEQDRDRLAHLSRMNRIANRMHRNSQNLLVLAGHELSSGWNQPMPLVNVIRAAVSEVEEYERVSLHPQPDIALSGPVVNDAVHLLAELTENATSFSAVDMPVEISGYLSNGGGVVIDITDRGVGMSANELAYANWRLENPPAADIDVPKWIGVFVVARLAARHGIRVRLQQAEFGGLTALVWFPDEIIIHHGAAAPGRPSGSASAGPRRGSHEAAGDLGRGTVERSAAMARSAELTSPREDARGAQLGRRLMSDAGRRPDPAGSAEGARPVSQVGPLVSQVGPPATAGPSGPGSSAPGRTGTSQLASAPFEDAAPLNSETSSAGGEVVVPSAETRRLPIFDSLEARWFSGSREAPGSSGVTATAGRLWSSPADEGWRAAETVEAPVSGAPTSAGLPKRLPKANLVPGSIPSTQPVVPNRSPAAARDRLARFQRGVSEGRVAASEVADPGGEDQSLTGWHDTSG